MKKSILIIVCILISNLSFGQHAWDGPDNNTDHIDRKGEVTVYNKVTVNAEEADVLFNVISTGTTLAQFNNVKDAVISGIRVSQTFGDGTPNVGDLLNIKTGFGIGAGLGNGNGPLDLTTIDARKINLFITNDGNGYVGIGTIEPDEKLSVNGTIHAREVRVDLIGWPPDYVFEKYFLGHSILNPDYEMPTLQELEVFIKENHHLPEVPSAKELKENGMKLKEMTNLLLQKVEELTLYTIEQEKRIQALEAKLNAKQ